MPITASAKKALRQSATRRVRNLQYLSKIRLLSKQIKKLASQSKMEDAKALLPKLYKALDKSAKENIIKRNNAARNKSRITKLLSKTTTAR